MIEDPRGPVRTITAVGNTRETSHILTLNCGHVREFVPHYTYRVGDLCRCLLCVGHTCLGCGRSLVQLPS